MDERTPPSPEDRAIGAEARRIRRRRGLSLDVAAGLAGISKQYLSKLETGKARFTRRGLIEDLAQALSCSVADLTGQPYVAPDQQSARAARVIPALTVAIHDATLDDAPDVPARPVLELARAARQANEAADQVDYIQQHIDLAAIVAELHVQAARGDGEDRRAALAALAEACMAAQALARTLGHQSLAIAIARRGYEAAQRLERDDLVGLMAMNRGHALMRLGARHQASTVLARGIAEAAELPGPTRKDTRLAQARGMLHLSAALLGTRDDQPSDAATHLEEAQSLAAFIGEGNHMLYHFGQTNVATWELTIGVEREDGPEAAERFLARAVDVSVLDSKDRASNVHLDLARAWAQAEGARDDLVIRELDTADRIAPLRVRNDPIARDLVADLYRRAKRQVWELDSLKRRLGVT